MTWTSYRYAQGMSCSQEERFNKQCRLRSALLCFAALHWSERSCQHWGQALVIALVFAVSRLVMIPSDLFRVSDCKNLTALAQSC